MSGMEERNEDQNWFSRPGDSLIAAIGRRGLTTQEVASHLSGGLEQLRGYVVGSARIDAPGAAALSRVVGGSADFWLKRQENYERALDRVVADVPTAEADVWLTSIPVPGSKPKGRAAGAARLAELRRRMAFYGVASLEAWESRYGAEREGTRFRTSLALASNEGAVSLWLRQGELEAGLIDTRTWDPSALRDRLSGIKKLSLVGRVDRFLPKLRAMLAEAGVALVGLRAPKECKASGASRRIRPDKVMLLVSFRHRSDDQFWFTVFHEIGHLLLHDAKTFVDGEDTETDEREREANEFASGLIVPSAREPELERLRVHYNDIARFAISLGVAPGLVLGQLEHRGLLERGRFPYLRRRWTWDEIDSALASL